MTPPANMKDGGAIRAGFNSEVDELRDIMHGGKGYLSNLEARYREETGIPQAEDRLQQGVRLLY